MAIGLFVIQQPHTIAFSGTPIIYSFACAPYTIAERNQDIRISVRVEKETIPGSDAYREIKSQLIYPDAGGRITIDISSIADAYLKYFIPRADLNTQIQAHGSIAKFRCVVVIQQAGIMIGTPLQTSPVILVKGGLAYDQYQFRNFFDKNIFENKQSLHYFTNSETVRHSDKKFLYWMNNRDPQENQICSVDFHLGNGGLINHDFTTLLYSRKYGIFVMPIGLNDLLNISGIPATSYKSGVIKYTVQVYTVNVSTVETIVAPVTFYVDHRNYYNSSQLLYINSLGAMDDIGILGQIDSAAEYNTFAAQQVTPPGGLQQAILQPQSVTWSDEIETFSGSTTFISKDKINRLRDLMLSKHVFEIKNGQLIPVNINKKTVQLYSSNDGLFSMAIDWQHAYSNQFYTPPGAIAADSTCPALTYFIPVQISRNTMQIMWSCPQPYDMVKLEIDTGTPDDLVTQILYGNAGSEFVQFNNTATYPNKLPLTIRGSIICNQNTDPIELGPTSTALHDADANSIPVAVDDVYTIQAGYTTSIVLSPSVLDNDYDPDGDTIEAITASGTTAAGGAYSINSAGIVTYTPPSAIYNGTDSFNYSCRDVITPAITASAEVRIQVGNINLGSNTYVKMIERNHFQTQIGGNFGRINSGGDYYITFWADPAATIPKNLTGLGLNINVTRKRYNYTSGGWVFMNDLPLTFNAINTEMLVYSGITIVAQLGFGQQVGGSKDEYIVAPGTNYIPI